MLLIQHSFALEEEEKQFEIERAQAAAKNAFNQGNSRDNGRQGRGGRGGARGRGGRGGGRGRGGRGGNRSDRGDRNAEAKEKAGAEEVGEKRKRAVEPDGGPDTGIRGKGAPPTIVSVKKVKSNDGTATAPSS